MQVHTSIYFEYFGYDISSFIKCEVCSMKANEIHHIKPKGMGGSKTKDYIENLMAICRTCHDKVSTYGMEYLIAIHTKFMERYGNRDSL